MTVQSSLKRNMAYDLPRECERARAGSSWAGLLVAISIKPDGIEELMRAVGLKLGRTPLNLVGFDAVADAWSMYQQALVDGADL